MEALGEIAGRVEERSFTGAEKRREEGVASAQATIAQRLRVNVFIHLAQKRIRLYNGMGSLQRKRSQLFSEASRVVKELHSFFPKEAGSLVKFGEGKRWALISLLTATI